MRPAELHYDDLTHTYSVGGVIVPSVTQILAPLRDFSMIPPAVLERKRAIGVAVHKATELDDEGTLVPESVHPIVQPYLDGYRRWRSEMNVEVISSEEQIWHPRLRYAGTFDLRIRMAGRKWIVDKKTAETASASWALQTAAYREPLFDKDEYACAALILRADGRYHWIPYDAPKHRGDFGVFAGLISLHHWKKANGL